MEHLKMTCPKDGTAMVVICNDILTVDYQCPVCGVTRPHFQRDVVAPDVLHKPKEAA